MTGSIDTNRSLAYGLVLSVAFHAAAVMGVVTQGVFRTANAAETVLLIPPPEEPKQEEPPKPEQKEEEPPPLKLGIEDSTAVTKTWIGVKDPTKEHSGLISETEQAQVAIEPGGAPPAPVAEETSEQGKEVESPEQTQPQPEATPPPAPSLPPVPAPQPPQPEAKPDPVEHQPEPLPETRPPLPEPMPAEQPLKATPEALPTETDPEDLPAGDSPEALPELSPPKPEERPPTIVEQQPAPPPPPVAPPPAPVPAPQAGAKEATAAKPPKPAKELKSRADFTGIADDRIAVATALKEAVDVVPGRPAAAKGMRVRTIPPRPSVTTQLTAAPRNAVMWVIFGADGKVKDTDFFAGQSTGSDGWDGALRSAVFAWKASGEEIDKLSKTDPRAGISVMFKISMR